MLNVSGSPTGIGLGLRAAFSDEVAAGALSDSPVAFLEVAPENYMHRGGKHPRLLAEAAERHPLITHGLTLGLGGSDPFNADYLDELRGFVARYGGAWHSDHLCFTGVDGALLHDLLPLPHTLASARHAARRVNEVAERIGKPMAVENVSYYVHMGRSEMDEAEFLREVAETADCGILLDVNNVLVNSKNLGFDPYEWLAKVPLSRVVQLHVAGHERWDEHDMWVDTHGAPVVDPVYDLMQWVVERTGPLPVLLERDANVPPLAELVNEVERLDTAYREALSRWEASLD